MGTKTGEFIAALTGRHDVIVIGGLAVIAHGFNRPTKDADIWLDPMESSAAWAAVVEGVCAGFDDISIHTLPGWRRVSGQEITNREKDGHDIRFLESKVRSKWIELLPAATKAEAEALLERFVDWQTCEAALRNPDAAVREIALRFLSEFAAEGDPFSQAILDGRTIPPI